MTKTILMCTIAAAVVAGCAKQQAPAVQKPAAPAAPASVANESGIAPAGSLSGTVVETMDAGGYTYLKLRTPAGEVWTAVPQTKAKVGDNVTLVGTMQMEKFESKTLKRTFDRIIFGNLAQGVQPAAMAAPPHAMTAPKTDLTNIKVEKASGADAKTVAELFASKSLKDAPVTVRGKVVKFLPSIMGKNWVHLRDGSGSEKAGDNDLVVTTSDNVAVGDVVTAKGTVRRDKDFGAGYTYVVIVEEASVKK